MESFILRRNPYFEIILKEESFEINNTDFTYNNGIYRYNEFRDIEFLNSETDWGSTIFVFLTAFFMGGRLGVDETDARFLFHYHSGKKREVKLINCDVEIANRIYSQLINKIKSAPKI